MRVIVTQLAGNWTAELVNGAALLSISFTEEWMAKSYGTDLADTLECELSLIEEAT